MSPSPERDRSSAPSATEAQAPAGSLPPGSGVYVAALTIAIAAAWVGQFRDYLPMADDYPFKAHVETGLVEFVLRSFRLSGIRRSMAYFLNHPLSAADPSVTNYLAVGMHVCAALLLFAVAVRVSTTLNTALAGVALFGLFPAGFQAVTWAAGTYVIPQVILFLANLCLLIRRADAPRSRDWLGAAASFILTLAMCLGGEHLVFACLFSPPLALCIARCKAPGRVNWRQLRSLWAAGTPLAVTLYLVLAVATAPGKADSAAAGHLDLGNFHAATMLSVSARQIQNLFCVEPLWTPAAFTLWADQWTFRRMFAGAVLLLMAMVLLGRGAAAASLVRPIETRKRIQICMVLVAMMLGVSFTHALAGGYSASSRHQYVPLVIDSLLAACLIPAAWVSIEKARGKLGMATLIACGVAATWLTTTANRFELVRYQLLVSHLASSGIAGPVTLVYDPPLYSAWPTMPRLLSPSFHEDWVINLALEARSSKPIVLRVGDGQRIYVGPQSVSGDTRFGSRLPKAQLTQGAKP